MINSKFRKDYSGAIVEGLLELAKKIEHEKSVGNLSEYESFDLQIKMAAVNVQIGTFIGDCE